MKSVKIQSRQRLFDDFFAIDEARLAFEKCDGHMSRVVRRLSFERGDSVAVLLHRVAEARVVLVRQFRFPTLDKGPGWVTETLAGMLADGETPEDAVRREAMEELGYRVGTVEPISRFYLSPGGSSERILLYYAEVEPGDRVAPGGGVADEDEDIEPVELRLDEIPQALQDGRICDAKTVIALQWLLLRQGRS